MKIISFLILVFLLTNACTNITPKQIQVIPQPNSIIKERGYLKVGKSLQINTSSNDIQNIIQTFEAQLPELMDIKEFEGTKVSMILDEEISGEAYKLSISKKGIKIKAGTHHGIFNAFQSLAQIINFAYEKEGIKILPCCEIEDEPRFGWRGLMLDESRYFFGVEKVKQLLDVMAMHKLNVFHWHLTDEPGWRIEIKKYPKLTTEGGKGNYLDANAPATFYTQEQIKEIVEFAAQRYIQVIPEIDMPGHAAAANRAYPEFSGGGSKTHPEWTFNPGKEETYDFLTDILKEVAELFPAPFIHIGGDEVHFGNADWNTKPEVKQLMEEHNLADLKAVEKYFVNRMSDTINALYKKTMGWDEIVDAGVSADKGIAMWWRHDKTNTLQHALEKDFDVILCPRIPLYFDFDQDVSHSWGRRWGGRFADLENVYNYPPDSVPNLSHTNPQILGIQANIWSERIDSNDRLDFMTHPRLSAMAEAAWTYGEKKDFKNFTRRLKPMIKVLEEKGIYYFNFFEPESTPEPKGVEKKKR